MEPSGRFELPTRSLQSHCSTAELQGQEGGGWFSSPTESRRGRLGRCLNHWGQCRNFCRNLFQSLEVVVSEGSSGTVNTPPDPPVGRPHVALNGATRSFQVRFDFLPLRLGHDVGELSVQSGRIFPDPTSMGSQTVVAVLRRELNETIATSAAALVGHSLPPFTDVWDESGFLVDVP